MVDAPTVTRAFAEEQVDFPMGEGVVLTNDQYEAASPPGRSPTRAAGLAPSGA
jgi:hypothetical protein